MRTALYFSILCALFQAQSQNTIGDFLSATVSEPELQLVNQQKDFLSNESFNLPIFKDVEVRVGTTGTDERIEDYRLRLELLNPAERSASKAYNQEFQRNLEAKELATYSDVLFRRYLLLMNHYIFTRKRELLDSTLLILGIERSLSSNSYKLLQLDIKETKMTLELSDMKEEISMLESNMSQSSGSIFSPNWPIFKVISSEEMTIILSSGDGSESPYEGLSDSEVTLGLSKLELEKKNARRAIGFIQPEYNLGRGNVPGEHWGIQVGVSIPIVNPDKADLQYEKLKTITRSSEAEIEKEDWIRVIEQLKSNFNLKQIQLAEVQNKVTRSKQVIEQSTGSVDDFRLIEYNLELQKIKLSILKEVFESYLNLLRLNGQLNSIDRRNYFSENLEEY